MLAASSTRNDLDAWAVALVHGGWARSALAARRRRLAGHRPCLRYRASRAHNMVFGRRSIQPTRLARVHVCGGVGAGVCAACPTGWLGTGLDAAAAARRSPRVKRPDLALLGAVVIDWRLKKKLTRVTHASVS